MQGQGEITSDYFSFLLRVWHTESGGRPLWRASLEEPLTQEVTHFDGLASLFEYLLSATGQGIEMDGVGQENPPSVSP